MSHRSFILSATTQLLLCAINVALGIMNLHKHRPIAIVSFSFACAGFILTLLLRSSFSHYRAMREFHEIIQLQQQANALFQFHQQQIMAAITLNGAVPVSDKALKSARENFSKIVTALGKNVKSASCECAPGDPHILFRKGEFDYLIRYGSVVKLKETQAVSSTCTQYQGGALPMEQVAAVALLLNHNPRLFEKWRDNHHYFYV